MNKVAAMIARYLCGIINAIDFHLGGLDLYPASIPVTHTES